MFLTPAIKDEVARRMVLVASMKLIVVLSNIEMVLRLYRTVEGCIAQLV